MSNPNIPIVEEYIEQVLNQKRLDRLPAFCSEDCVIHAAPYVGLGASFDDTSGQNLVVSQVALNSPAHGHVQVGDELVRVRSDEHTWESFDTLRRGTWACGRVGAEVAITIRRHGNLITIPLRLGQIDLFDIKLSDFYKITIPDMKHYWPDFKIEIRQIFGDDNRVACYLVNHGTNVEYNRCAVWSEMDIFGLKDGKITEIWRVESTFEELKQLGYQISEPSHEIA